MSCYWNKIFGGCPVEHYHEGDPTRRPGYEGNEPGAQNGPHYHAGSDTCVASPDGPRPHHHVGDPTWRAA